MNNSLEEKIKELRQGYVNKLRETFPELKDLLYQEPINILDIYSKVHTIAGTSGMYGLQYLSELSTKFEFYLKPLKENIVPINTDEFKIKFSEYLDSIEKIILVGE